VLAWEGGTLGRCWIGLGMGGIPEPLGWHVPASVERCMIAAVADAEVPDMSAEVEHMLVAEVEHTVAEAHTVVGAGVRTVVAAAVHTKSEETQSVETHMRHKSGFVAAVGTSLSDVPIAHSGGCRTALRLQLAFHASRSTFVLSALCHQDSAPISASTYLPDPLVHRCFLG